MFDSLSGKFSDVFDKLRRRGALSEADVSEALREIRLALLDADVALPVVKDFIAEVREKAVGAEVLRSVSPGQMVVKIVNDALVAGPGRHRRADQPARPCADPHPDGRPAGLRQNHHLRQDRAAAEDRASAKKCCWPAWIPSAPPRSCSSNSWRSAPRSPACRSSPARRRCRSPTAPWIPRGAKSSTSSSWTPPAASRSTSRLMEEVKAIRHAVNPVETLLVVDAMTGQDAVTTATAFNEALGITGIVMTRLDGDARGGAALSMRAVTGAPIKLVGTGEKLDALDNFDPERIAGRILGMGDIVGLVERAAETIDQDEAEKLAKKMAKGKFDLEDYASQLKQIAKMGSLSGIIGMLPGIGKIKKQLEDANLETTMFKRQAAIIGSMTQSRAPQPGPAEGQPQEAHRRRLRHLGAGGEQTAQTVRRNVDHDEAHEQRWAARRR